MDGRRINRISLIVLIAGFATAAALWMLAAPPPEDAWSEDALNEKRYRRELRVIGGQANQLSADFIAWVGSLWRGRRLAGTVVVLTVVATAGFRFVAVRMGPPAEAPLADR